MPRVKLLATRDDVAPEHYPLFEELAALRGRVSGPSSVVLYSPALSKPWNDQSEFLHRDTVVEPAASELAMIATAREKDCAFIWNAHVGAARKAGVAEATVTAVRENRPTAGLPASEAAVVEYVRGLLRDNRVDEAVFGALHSAHGAQWLVELTAFVGRYGALAGILNAFEVLPGPGADPLPVPSPVPVAARTAVRPPLAQPRVTPITQREQVAEAHRAIFDAVAEGRGNVRGPFSILMHSPVLCMRFIEVSNYLRFNSLVKPNPGELAIIATAREKDCPYVWAAHAPLARKAGVREEAIAAVRDRAALNALTPDEHDVVGYVRQLLRANRVEQPLFDRLTAAHGTPWLVECTALIGHYGMITAQLNAFEVAPAPGAEQLPLG
jgi:4-carboxymuconolactone decarboxylase